MYNDFTSSLAFYLNRKTFRMPGNKTKDMARHQQSGGRKTAGEICVSARPPRR